MPGNMYTWLFQKYRGSVANWSTEKELSSQLKAAYLNEAHRLLMATGQQEPPFDPLRGLRFQKVHDFRWIDGLPEEARLIPDDQGFTLWLRSIEPKVQLNGGGLPTRLRTTLAHELGHTLFYDLSTFPPRSSSSYMSSSGLHDRDMNEEWWCMDFARAYLIPDFWVANNLSPADFPSLRFASEIRRELLVSWDILFRRLMWDLKVWRACIVFRVDPQRLQLTGLWKSDEFKSWSFKRWLEFEGIRLIAHRPKATSLFGESTCEIANSKGEVFQLRLLETPSQDTLLGAICTVSSEDDERIHVPTGVEAS